MFPYVDSFLRNFRITGKDMVQSQQAAMNSIKAFGGVSSSSPAGMRAASHVGLLEEIAEVTEAEEQKRCKQLS